MESTEKVLLIIFGFIIIVMLLCALIKPERVKVAQVFLKAIFTVFPIAAIIEAIKGRGKDQEE